MRRPLAPTVFLLLVGLLCGGTGCSSTGSSYDQPVECSDSDDDGGLFGAIFGCLLGGLFDSVTDWGRDDLPDDERDVEKPRGPQYPIRVRGERNYDAVGR